MKKWAVFTLCILTAVSVLYSQDWKGKGRVGGTVLDEQGKPLEDVTVKFFCPQYNGGFEAKSDKEGRFFGSWMRSGSWEVRFSKIGYMPRKETYYISQTVKNADIIVNLKKTEGLVVTDDIIKELTAANDLFDKKDYEGALAAYKALLDKNPDAYIVWMSVGHCYFVQDKYDEAMEAYRKVLDKDPGNVEAAVSTGNCYTNKAQAIKGDTREDLEKQDLARNQALDWYAKVPIEKINDVSSLTSIGLAFKAAQKTEEAVPYFKRAIAVDPANTDALYELGLCYASSQNTAEAVAVFEEYLKIDPDSERAEHVRKFLDYMKK